MTREEHLVFCKKCLNRKFDSENGLICGITNEIADFEDTCENFSKDESVKEEVPEQAEERTHAEVMAALPEDVIARLRPHQDMIYAFVGGLLVAIVCAIVWAAITVSTEYQIGYMAVAVGFLVGMGVRYFGAGIDQVFGIAGAFLALLGCVLGNLFSQVGFIAHDQSMSYFEVLSLLTPDLILMILQESFHGMDLLFYGIAVYEGYRFAFRPIPENIMEAEDLTPAGAKYRLPLVIASFVLIGFTGFRLSEGVTGEQTFYYESGKPQSHGAFESGNQHGTWTYYYESGEPMLFGDFDNGYEVGKWTWLDMEGNVQKVAHYERGLYHGVMISFYANGTVQDSSVYEMGRQSGPNIGRFEDGTVSYAGSYKRDKQQGMWQHFYPDGTLQSRGQMKDASNEGLWEFWYADGTKQARFNYLTADDFEILDAWDPQGKVLVQNGSGIYQEFNELNQVTQSGSVENGKRSGVWKLYYANGQIMEEGRYKDGIYLLDAYWTDKGEQLVTDGNGEYLLYQEGSDYEFQKGNFQNGLKTGSWELYYPLTTQIFGEMSYVEGKLNGEQVTYNESGGIYQQGEFKDDKRVGEWSWYYENGQLQCTVNYIDGEKDGVQKFWTETGLDAKEEVYEAGKLISETFL